MIGVLGPGGVGGLVAARLANAGHDVTIVATERTAAEITVRGLTCRTPDGTTVTHPKAQPWLTDPVDVLFVAVKATELLPALHRVPAGVLRNATIVPFLNGVDHVPLLRALYPEATVVAASIAVEAARHRPGVVEQLSPFADVVLTEPTPVAELLVNAGLAVKTHPDENTVLWRKLSFLAPFALLTTGANAPVGQARRKPWLNGLVDEAAAAAADHGVHVEGVAERIMSLSEGMQSSMLRDFRAGRQLELDAIAGPVIRTLGADKAPTTVEVARTILDAAQAP